jgi:hypothetical protein
MVLMSVAVIWFLRTTPASSHPILLAGIPLVTLKNVLHGQLALTVGFILYQIFYWIFFTMPIENHSPINTLKLRGGLIQRAIKNSINYI